MSRRAYGKYLSDCFFVTSTIKEWKPLGEINHFYEKIQESISFCLKKYNAKLAGYVLMPNHIHLILSVEKTHLPNFMRDFKKFTAQKVAVDLGLPHGGIWMPRYDRFEISDREILLQKLNYIHNNPVKKGLIDKAEEWKWSSANYYVKGIEEAIEIWTDWW